MLPLILQWATYLWPSHKWGFIINYIQYSYKHLIHPRIPNENIISLRLTKLWIPHIRLDVPTIHNIVSPRYRDFEAQCISLIDKSKDTNYEYELIKGSGLRSIHKPTIKCKVLVLYTIKQRFNWRFYSIMVLLNMYNNILVALFVNYLQ